MAFVISHKYKFVFVHIPKTGGTSVCTVDDEPFDPGYMNGFLGEGDIRLPHQHILHARTILGEYDFDNYLKFAVYRDPHDRVKSMYFSQKSNVKRWKTFGDFIDYLDIEDIFSVNMVYWPQWYWIASPYEPDIILINRLIPHENLIFGVKNVLDICGVEHNGTFPHIRKTEYPEIIDYTDSMKSVVERIYARDFGLVSFGKAA